VLLHAPTPLALGDLTALTRDVAAEVRAGVHPVHAYSPPLTAMSYYAVEPGARLRRTRSVLVESAR